MNYLERAKEYLVINENYYGNLLFFCNIKFTKNVPTLGVYVTEKINIEINEDFFNPLSVKHQMGWLKHELDHVIYGHTTAAHNARMSDRQIANIAQDIYINERNKYLKDFEGACYVDSVNKMFGLNMVHGKDVYYYYKELMKKADEIKAKMGPIDDHSKHGQTSEDGVPEDIKRDIIKSTLEKAARVSGSVPLEIEEMIASMNKPQISWRRKLRKFVANVSSNVQKFTRTRHNRRMGISQPGKRNEYKLSVAVCIDTSGSVSDKEFELFLPELVSIADAGGEVNVIECDSKVQAVYPFKKNKTKPKFKGRGGTNYNPAIEKAKTFNPDLIIYFGDGDPAGEVKKYKGPFLWVLTNDVKPPGDFGSKLVLDKVT